MSLRTRTIVSGAILLLAACSSDSPAPAGATQSGQPARGGAAGGRGASAITLAATDVATLAPTTLEEATAISGDLRPIETIQVRARIEGDLLSVHVREGDQVRPGQLLARFESGDEESSRRSAEADRAAAQSEVANAQWNFEQSQQLFRAGAIAERDLKITEQTLAAARARLAAAEARLRSSTTTVNDTRVLSPTRGIVAERSAEAGEHVSRGASLFTVVRNDVLELAAAVPSRQAGPLRVGQTVSFVADGRTFAGKVARVSPTIDEASRAVRVYVQVPNPSGALRGGTFATGRVVSRVLSNVIAVPLIAVRQSQAANAPFVYRVEDGALAVVPVTLGAVDERQGLVQVVDGLTAGDRVVVGNVGNLGRGMKVNVVGGETGRGARSGGAPRP